MNGLETYLNDHLAGSVAGLAIVDHLIDAMSDSPASASLRDLKAEIEKDRDELRGLMKKLGVEESSVRKAGAWLSEKAAELKLRFDDPSGGPLLIFESLEALSLGIEGKRGLWRALAVTSETHPELKIIEYGPLRKKAKKQREFVESLRLQYSIDALAPQK